MTLTKDVEALRDRTAPIEMTGAEFRDAGHGLVDQIADWLEALPHGPVMRDESPADVRRAAEGRPRAAGIRHRRASAARRGGELLFRPLALQRPSTFLRLHHVEPGADRRARRSARVGRQPERRRLAPGADGDRDRSADGPLDCGADRVSRPRPADCWSAAATWRTSSASSPRAPPRRRRRCGPQDCDRWPAQLRVYASIGNAHLDPEGRRSVRHRHRRDSMDRRRRSAADGHRCARTTDRGRHRTARDLPFLVVGTAGSVGTGVVDPLVGDRGESAGGMTSGFTWTARTARWPRGCRAHRRACSASATPIRSRSIRTSGCTRRSRPAARWCVAPPICCGAFSYHPSYYHFDHEVTNYFDYGPQNSRGFRALKVWLALRHVGKSGYLQMIGDDMRLARHLHALVQRHPDFEAIDPASQHHDVPIRSARPAVQRRRRRRSRRTCSG